MITSSLQMNISVMQADGLFIVSIGRLLPFRYDSKTHSKSQAVAKAVSAASKSRDLLAPYYRIN